MHQKDEWQCSPGLGLRTSSQVLLTGLMVCHCLSFIAHKSLTILDCIPKGSHTEPTLLLLNSPRSYIKRLIFSHDITGVGCTTMVSKNWGLWASLVQRSLTTAENIRIGFVSHCLLYTSVSCHIFLSTTSFFLSLAFLLSLSPPSVTTRCSRIQQEQLKLDTSQLKSGPQPPSCGSDSLNPEKPNIPYPLQ